MTQGLSAGYDAHGLPKDERLLVDTLNNHVQAEIRNSTPKRSMWVVCWLYLNGIRDFTRVDFARGKVEFQQIKIDALRHYTHQGLLAKHDEMVGKLMQLDVAPLVRPGSTGLDPKKKASAAQVILDSLYDPTRVEVVKQDIFLMLSVAGTCGASSRVVRSPKTGMFAIEWECVPPWELLPYPSIGLSRSSLRGDIRHRWVTLEHIRSISSPEERAILTRREADLNIKEIPFGDRGWSHILQGPPVGATTAAQTSNRIPTSKKKTEPNVERLVEVTELWLYGPLGEVNRYIRKAGDVILTDIDFDKNVTLAYPPIAIARYTDSSGYYGTGLCERILSANMNIEKMLDRLFHNVSISDAYGMLLMPSTQVDINRDIKATPWGFRFIPYDMDPMSAQYGARPQQIMPANTGTIPGQVAQLAGQVMESLAPTPTMDSGRAPGRIDGRSGLEFLEEQSQNPLNPVRRSVNQMFATVYRSQLTQAVALAASDSGTASFPVRRLDESLIGLVFSASAAPSTPTSPSLFGEEEEDDEQAGDIIGTSVEYMRGVTMSLAKNPISDIPSLSFQIRGQSSRSDDRRVAQLLDLFSRGIISQEQLLLTNIREGLNLPIYAPEVEGALRKAVLDVLLMFGDGITPGNAVSNPDQDIPWVHLMVMDSVMATPEFAAASNEVRTNLIQRKQMFQQLTGVVLPGGMAPPDDMALLQQAEMAMQQSQQGAMQRPQA